MKKPEVMTKLSTKQIRAAQLEATGMKAVDIAEEISVTPQTISTYRKKEEYQVMIQGVMIQGVRLDDLTS